MWSQKDVFIISSEHPDEIVNYIYISCGYIVILLTVATARTHPDQITKIRSGQQLHYVEIIFTCRQSLADTCFFCCLSSPPSLTLPSFPPYLALLFSSPFSSFSPSSHAGLAATNDTDNAELFSIVDATGDAWFQIYAAIFHEKDEKRKVAE